MPGAPSSQLYIDCLASAYGEPICLFSDRLPGQTRDFFADPCSFFHATPGSGLWFEDGIPCTPPGLASEAERLRESILHLGGVCD